jgi:hypothetical protein
MRPGTPWLLFWLLALCLLAPAGQAARVADDPDAFDTAQAFLLALQEGDAELLYQLGTDPFTFDGRILTGEKAIASEWEHTLARAGHVLRAQEKAFVEILDYPRASRRFGIPPQKLSHLDLRSCLFAVVAFEERDGFLLVLKKKDAVGYRVAGVTD